MIRKATEADIPRLVEIRSAVWENKLRDVSLVTLDDYRWFIANPGVFVCDEDGRVVGFSAGDPRDGSIWALFIDPAYEGRGFGRSLLGQACTTLRAAGCKRLWLKTLPGTRAQTFYLKAGWKIVGMEGDQLILSL